jgi:CBS domain-containing protein
MTDVDLPVARDWMTRDTLMLRLEDDVLDAIDRLLGSDLASAPVVDETGSVVGVFTEKDAVRALSQVMYNELAETSPVERHMSRQFTCCEADWDLFRVSELFLASNFPGLPVIEDGKLVGVIRRKGQIKGLLLFRKRLDRAREQHEAVAGQQADRPRGIEALQRAAAEGTPDQLARLFGRRRND